MRILRPLATLALLTGTHLLAFAAPQPVANQDPLGSEAAVWSPLSTTAQTIGTLKTAPGSMTILNQPIQLGSPELLSGTDLLNAAKLFSTHPVPGSAAALYKVSIPPTFRLREKNTFCGKQTVTWLLLLRIPSGPDHGLEFATFTSTGRPDLSPAAINNSTDLCGTYGFLPTGK